MAELILPLTRTLFLPSGSPGLGSVEAVRGDLRELRCGSSDGETYCLGEADILVEYTASSGSGGLFASDSRQQERPGSWQALLSFPFQLSGPGQLPAEAAYRVELGPLHWTMVAARAIELETSLSLSWPDQAAAPAQAEQGTAGAVWPEPSPEPAAAAAAAAVITAEKESEAGYIMRPPDGRGTPEKIKRGGEWRMVDYDQEARQRKQDAGGEAPGEASQLREQEQAAAAGLRTVEIVDLSGTARPEMREALARALAQSSPVTDRPLPAPSPPEPAYTISKLFPPAPATAAGESVGAADTIEKAAQEAMEKVIKEAVEQAGADSSPVAIPEEAVGEALAETETVPLPEPAQEARSAPEQAPEYVKEAISQLSPEIAPESTGVAAEIVEESAAVPVAAAAVARGEEAEPAAVKAVKAEPERAQRQIAEPQVPEPQVPEPVAMKLQVSEPVALRPVAPEPVALEPVALESVASEPVALEPEVLEPQPQPPPQPPRPKRRFQGLPGLYVEARDNDIDLTAFHISIKL